MSTTTIAPAQITPEALAAEFVLVLRGSLTSQEISAVVELNQRDAALDVCHSHDVCDANMVMLAAHAKLLGVPQGEAVVDLNDDATMRLWTDAWNMAKAANFVWPPQAELQRDRADTLSFDHGGQAIRYPLLDESGRIAVAPSYYGFIQPSSGTLTTWTREFMLDGQPVLMTLVDPQTGLSDVRSGNPVRIAVSREGTEEFVSWIQDADVDAGPRHVLFSGSLAVQPRPRQV